MTLSSRITNYFRRTQRHPAEANNILPAAGIGHRYTQRKYSDIYLWLILHKIFNALKTVRFEIRDTGNLLSTSSDFTTNLCHFLEDNIISFVWMYYTKGYIILEMCVDARGVYTNNFAIPRFDIIRTDNNGHVLIPDGRQWVVVYGDEYLTTRKASFDIIANELQTIDELRSADEYLTKTFGSVGILSSKDMPMLAEDKEAFMSAMKSSLGIMPDKYQFLISSNPVTYTSLNLPIADLDIRGRVTDTLKLLCDYFCIPFDIISYSGNSTYANMEAAVRLFYTNCIAPLAEVILTAGRHAIRRNTTLLVMSDCLTYEIDNITIDDEKRKAQYSNITLLADVATKLASLPANHDIEEAMGKITNIINSTIDDN